ncbi:TetR/AcrR family transcriptional regulator [Nonomuraea sp. NEAU-A123]|uniref:TetR/AcrR family transcriptional regulator n=1 Tax=Nonomuraea sp. NEAU-A123 TaxID=2839649 RepID=UPI001BE44F43|nr:TetR/AcrR family transcriptional regulator [Nonomuraea sp. NEAU-A123]MBT2225612.1 TetR/AcrR family transcriptional regulator [Nonomuraea sp. NEAU-A123]
MPNPPNPQRRSEKSRRATLDATLDLCAEQGYAQVTVEGIAARAGVSKKTVYRWWPSKGAVVLEAVHDAAVRPTVFPDTGDLVADLCTQLSGVIDVLSAPRTRSAFIGVLTEAQHDPGLAEQMHRQWIGPRIDQFKHRLRKAQDQGHLPPGADLDVIMDVVYGPIFHRLMVHLPLPDEAYLRKVVDSVLPASDQPPRER